MKIASLETGIVLLPNDEPLAGFSENPNAKNPIVWLRVRTDDGIEGLGVTYFGGALTRTLRMRSTNSGALIVGEDPLRVEAVHAEAARAAGGSAGPGRHLTWRCRRSTSRCGTSRARRSGCRCGSCSAAARDRIRPMPRGALRRGLARRGGHRRRPRCARRAGAR
jgi:hypothetical protein